MPLTTNVYPTSAEFRELEREYEPILGLDDPAFRHFPIRERNTWNVVWRQKDNYTGMQQPRGINGEPPRVVPLGENLFSSEPGVYGEHAPIDERELTMRADITMGTGGMPMPTESMIDERAVHLFQRRNTRIKNTIWELMVTGAFTVRDIKGAVVHSDSYTQIQFTSTVAWSTAATSTPLADFRSLALLGRGTSANFRGGATAYMNQVTANRMMSNTNAADLGGKKGAGLSSITSLSGWNTVLSGEGLPTVEVYEGGYLPENSTTFTLWIPDNVVIVVGTRPGGVTPGEYQMVVNANNPGRASGPYTAVSDNIGTFKPVPREIHVHDGHSGGPALEYPGMIVRMNV